MKTSNYYFIDSSIGYTTAVKCVLNPYYNPICGTDHKTYGNKDLLNCYNRQRPRQRRKYEFVFGFFFFGRKLMA